MLKQTILKWTSSLETYKNGNNAEALKMLKSVEPTAKILYNIGIIHFKMGNYKESIDNMTHSTELDKYLALSFFMRGVCYHQMDDTSHAIVDYDESISKLRGHEFIDYTQLGLSYRLTLTEILFNKALALGPAGGSVAQLAAQCKVMPSDQTYRENLRQLCEGQKQKVRTAPLDVLFRPPKVNDQAPPKITVEVSSPAMSSAPSALKTSGERPLPSKPLPTPSPAGGAKPTITIDPPTPPKQLPSSPKMSSPLPPPPPPAPLTASGKRLPSRPISAMVAESKITIKCYFADRRLIQITSKCTVKELRQKIAAKFDEADTLDIRYKLTDTEFSDIITQGDLDIALRLGLQELYLTRHGQPNQHEVEAPILTLDSFINAPRSPSPTPMATSPPPPSIPKKPTSLTTSSIWSTTTSTTPTPSPLTSSYSPAPTPPAPPLKKLPFSPPPPPLSSSPSASLAPPPKPPSVSLSKSATITTPSKPPMSGVGGLRVATRPRGQTADNIKLFEQQQQQQPQPLKQSPKSIRREPMDRAQQAEQADDEVAPSNKPEQLSHPFKLCVSPSGEQFYLNTETGQVSWTHPGGHQ
ncbi:hypothetical protein SAMD00019534_105130 [Acytostelium subglobosum LB1]|uniref:hypothetical protein n=1 Tax=Acytostelium subglobosum LB1 TaxID=1410327 RepID=UPI000644E432|nr:hypothetical protein SAMD00019534_105130 [Acytostelium subglobosum LB1]GAM27338.1 hypothetical protein SAMD00019534_105130 [Acytostelium subglobosum LB1]|eukprot:XP_012749805.1 hypothetical protein SAMD00019534_105130 [Acytostelium subglobosum LB1]